VPFQSGAIPTKVLSELLGILRALHLVSIPSQGTLQDLYNLIYFKTQFHEFFYVQVSRLRISNSEPWMLNIEGIEEHINMLETNLDPVLRHCQEFQYLLDKSSGFF